MTAQPNANALIPTCAVNGQLSFPPVRTMQTVLTSLTAPQKSVHGPANPVINKKEALVFLLACPKKTKQVAAMEHIPAVMAVAETEPVAVPLR